MRDIKELLASLPSGEEMEALRLKNEAEWVERERQRKLFDRKHTIDKLRLPITAADQDRLLHDRMDTSVKAFDAVKTWLATDVPWLLLLGSTGRGKTLAGAWALVERGGEYVGARELERLATARYGDEVERYSELVDRRTLVVDDIGRERDTGNMTAALLDLVDARRKRGEKTIAISNVAKPAFLKTYSDERLLSRLGEPGVAMWVADVGEDLRRAKR